MRGKTLWMIVALGSIWLSVLFTSLFAPDLVSGSEQQHLPLAALIMWMFGLLATSAVIKRMARAKNPAASSMVWMALGLGYAGIWLAVALVSILAPVMVTGGDPTRLPLAVIMAPIAGLILSRILGEALVAQTQE